MPCFNPVWWVNDLLVDSVHNEINLLFNVSYSVCNTYFKGIVAYDGNNFHNLDIGTQTHEAPFQSGSVPNCVITFSNQTLFAGSFNSVGSSTLFAQSLALWDGVKWDTLAKKPFKYYPNKNDPYVSWLLKDKGLLYISGGFDTIGGVKANNLCTFDGLNYVPLNLPAAVNYGCGKMIRYKDGIYIAGYFYDTPNAPNLRLIKYNDNQTWSTVGNGVQGFAGGVYEMAVYKDTLYLAGQFNKADGNAGNYIMKWDGSQFHDAGFGNIFNWGAIESMFIYKDRLYTFGSFKYAADQKAYGAAYYQNGAWVVNRDSLNNNITSAVVYKDEIYIGGAFSSVYNDPEFKYFAKLRCPDFDGCKNENGHPDSETSLFPNPASTEINIHVENAFRYNSTISVYNDLGQLIFTNSINDYDFKINCTLWAKGIYLINLQTYGKRKSIKVVKE